MAKAKSYSAGELIAMIRAKYAGNAYAVLEQVADGTGGGCNSWIDAAVFSLWPSKGIWRAACEVKVSRADFLKELADPTKNQWAREHFDYFWYVVAPGVAKDDEIPTGCGLMTVRGGGLAVVKQAPLREDVKTDKWIIASFARSLDKERENFRNTALRDALESDHRYKRAIAWKEGVERYIKHCGDYCYADTSDEVFQKLVEVAQKGSPDATDAKHSLEVLGRLQDNVLNFLLDIAPLAAHLLNARDEAADYIVRSYGYRDEKCLESLRVAVKNNRRSSRRDAKCELQTRELVASLNGKPNLSEKGAR